MRDDDLCFLSVSEMAILLRERAVSSVELVEAHVGRIERLDDALRAFITVFADQARSTARLADEALAAGNDRRPLLGVPVAIKDEAGAAGFPGTFGCLALSEDVVQRDAVHTQRLRDAGAVVLGATNLPEFGHRGTTINRLRGATSTPFAVGMNAGGSSGGSAAAVASGMASVAHGSDGGGSVRIPAAMCGVVGFIGTYGRVPRVTRPDAYGGRGNFSYDGVLARSVRDAITTLRVMSGYDPRDPFSISSPVPLWEIPDVPARGIRVGWTADFNAFPMEQDVAERAWETVALLRSSGAHVDEVSIDLGYTGDEIAAICSRYISIGNAVRAVALSKRGFDLTGALRDLVDERILAHIDEGRRITAVDAKLDDIARSRILDSFRGGFEQFDVLISPTVAIPGISNAQASEQPGPDSVAGQSVDPFLGWALTVPVNFCGYPSMSVPAGRVYGLPIGIQIVAPHGREDLCIRVAAAVEELAPWKHTYLDARRALDTVSAHLEAADLPPS